MATEAVGRAGESAASRDYGAPFFATWINGLRPTRAHVGHWRGRQSAEGAVVGLNLPIRSVSTFPSVVAHAPDLSTLNRTQDEMMTPAHRGCNAR